jgi:hypothetical protein
LHDIVKSSPQLGFTALHRSVPVRPDWIAVLKVIACVVPSSVTLTWSPILQAFAMQLEGSAERTPKKHEIVIVPE